LADVALRASEPGGGCRHPGRGGKRDGRSSTPLPVGAVRRLRRGRVHRLPRLDRAAAVAPRYPPVTGNGLYDLELRNDGGVRSASERGPYGNAGALPVVEGRGSVRRADRRRFRRVRGGGGLRGFRGRHRRNGRIATHEHPKPSRPGRSQIWAEGAFGRTRRPVGTGSPSLHSIADSSALEDHHDRLKGTRGRPSGAVEGPSPAVPPRPGGSVSVGPHLRFASERPQ